MDVSFCNFMPRRSNLGVLCKAFKLPAAGQPSAVASESPWRLNSGCRRLTTPSSLLDLVFELGNAKAVAIRDFDVYTEKQCVEKKIQIILRVVQFTIPGTFANCFIPKHQGKMYGHIPSTTLHANRMPLVAKLQEPRFVCHGGVTTWVSITVNQQTMVSEPVIQISASVTRFENRVVYAYALWNVQ
jgi:hypothetical protein